jgi:hypothetical protein
MEFGPGQVRETTGILTRGFIIAAALEGGTDEPSNLVTSRGGASMMIAS